VPPLPQRMETGPGLCTSPRCACSRYAAGHGRGAQCPSLIVPATRRASRSWRPAASPAASALGWRSSSWRCLLGEAALQCTCGSYKFVLNRRVLQTASCMLNNRLGHQRHASLCKQSVLTQLLTPPAVRPNGSPAVPLCRAVVRGGTTGAAQPLQLSSLLPAMFVQPRWAQGRVSSAASRCSGQRRSSCCRAGRGPLAPRLQAAAQGICQPATCILPLLFAARLRQVLQLSAAGPHAWRSRSSQKTCAHRPCSAAAATAVPLLLLCRVLLLLLLLL
jgi:hypothetical protein